MGVLRQKLTNYGEGFETSKKTEKKHHSIIFKNQICKYNHFTASSLKFSCFSKNVLSHKKFSALLKSRLRGHSNNR